MANIPCDAEVTYSLKRVQLNRKQLEQLEDGRAVYYHSDVCGRWLTGFCDYACNDRMGVFVAEAYNQGREDGKP